MMISSSRGYHKYGKIEEFKQWRDSLNISCNCTLS